MKVLSLLLCAVLMFSLVACGGSDTDTESTFTNSSVSDTSKDSSTESSDTASADSSDVSDESSAASSDVSEDDSSDVSEDDSSDVSEEPEEPIIYDTLTIGKAKTAPVVDGEVSAKEYATEIKFDMSETHWNTDSSEAASAYNVVLYLSWDENYLYSAVSIGVGMPRTYNNTDYAQNRPHIFDRRHVMTAIVTSDPSDPVYISPDGTTEWTWGGANNSGLGNEWSISAQPDGTNICADHFNKVTANADYNYKVGVSKLENEVYEQAIPWSALQGAYDFSAAVGSVIGYAFSACCEEVDITVDEDPDAIHACFGSGVLSGKNFSQYVPFTLAD